jgi:hypothetical protein
MTFAAEGLAGRSCVPPVPFTRETKTYEDVSIRRARRAILWVDVGRQFNAHSAAT